VDETRVGTLRLFFENRHYDRDILLSLSSELSSICEISISHYLETGELDEAFTTLSFDSAVAEQTVPKVDEITRKRVA